MTKHEAINLLERAAWTFAQAFLAVWALSNFQLTRVALIGGVAAGISALKTLIGTISRPIA